MQINPPKDRVNVSDVNNVKSISVKVAFTKSTNESVLHGGARHRYKDVVNTYVYHRGSPYLLFTDLIATTDNPSYESWESVFTLDVYRSDGDNW